MLKYIATPHHIVAFHHALTHRERQFYVEDTTGEDAVTAGFLYVSEGDGQIQSEGKSVSIGLPSKENDFQHYGGTMIVLWNNWMDMVVVNEAFYQVLMAKGESRYRNEMRLPCLDGKVGEPELITSPVKGWFFN